MHLEDKLMQPPVVEKNQQEKLNFQILKEIHEKCTRQYEGKYSGPLFGINVDFSGEEILEIEKLLKMTKEGIDKTIKGDNLEETWENFNKLLEEKRTKFGPLAEDKTIVADDSVTDVQKCRTRLGDNEVAAIKVPTIVRDIYLRHTNIEHLENDLNLYKSGNMKGVSASNFGNNLRELYSLF